MLNKLKYLVLALPAFLAIASPVSAVEERIKVNLCHANGESYKFLPVEESAVDAHLDHGDFHYAGPLGEDVEKAEKDAWCEENVPVPGVPEFGLISGIIAATTSAGSFWALRRRFK